MSDFNIIRKIEKKLRIVLERKDEIGEEHNGYVLDDKENVIALSIGNLEIKNFNLIIPPLKELQELVELHFINNKLSDISSISELPKLIRLDLSNKITVKANGKDARGLIMLVMDALNNITEGYKGVKPEIHVPCTCSKCKGSNKPTTFQYDKLLEWSAREENIAVVCNENNDSFLIEELLYKVGLKNPSAEKLGSKKSEFNKSLKLFVSYSKYDEDYLQDFEDHLTTLKEERLVTFNCREIEFGKKWDEEIKKQIDECDIMVCLVSVKFLNTDYITKIEIPRAIATNKMIIPIIIKACDWETSALGEYQAAKRGKVVSLDNDQRLLDKIKSNSEEERAAFWTSIIKEFRKKIFS